MKIAYFVNQYPTVSHSFIRREIHALERMGVSVSRISLRKDSTKIVDVEDIEEAKRTRYILELPVSVLIFNVIRAAISAPKKFVKAMLACIRMGVRSDRGLFRNLFYLIEACTLKELIESSNIEHVHAHFGTNSTSIAMLSSMMGKHSYSFTVHGPEEFDKAEFINLALKIKHSKFVVAISSFCSSQLYRQVSSDFWKKIHIVHCGLDDKFLEADAIDNEINDDKEIIFTCVGRLCEQKGQLLLLDAFNKVVGKNKNVRLILAGDGPMRSEIEKKIADYNLGDHVLVTGWIDGEQVKQYLKMSRAMVLPSFAEGLPVVIMEAMAMRKPVITTYIAGIPELVENDVNGWLVPAGSPDSIATAMQAAIEASPPVLNQMGCQGKNRVAKKHNIDTEAAKLKILFGAAI